MTYLQGVVSEDGSFVAINALVYPQAHTPGVTEVFISGPVESIDRAIGTALIGGFSVDVTQTLGRTDIGSISVGDRFAAYGSAFPATNVSLFAKSISEIE